MLWQHLGKCLTMPFELKESDVTVICQIEAIKGLDDVSMLLRES